MKTLAILVLVALMGTQPIWASWTIYSRSVGCQDGLPYMMVGSYESMCQIPGQPYFESIALYYNGQFHSRISLELGSTPGVTRPCDNPRGWPRTDFLPIPISSDKWQVDLEGKFLGTLNLDEGCIFEAVES